MTGVSALTIFLRERSSGAGFGEEIGLCSGLITMPPYVYFCCAQWQSHGWLLGKDGGRDAPNSRGREQSKQLSGSFLPVKWAKQINKAQDDTTWGKLDRPSRILHCWQKFEANEQVSLISDIRLNNDVTASFLDVTSNMQELRINQTEKWLVLNRRFEMKIS